MIIDVTLRQLKRWLQIWAALCAALFALLFAVAPAHSGDAGALSDDILVAARPIRVGEIIQPGDVTVIKSRPTNAYLTHPSQAIGQEARLALYQGRPIRSDDLGLPTVVKRNDVITITFRRGVLLLRTEGRSLDRGSVGDKIRVLNLDSRRTIFATVAGPSLAEVN